MDPLVTIAIPSFNYAEFLGEAIQSALDQTYATIEVLVLDNASTDDSVAVARSFKDERVRLVVHPENLGLVPNYNAALRLASGEYVALLAADDRLLPTCVEDVMAFRRAHPEIDIAYTSVGITDASGRVMHYFEHPSFDGALSYVGRNELASLLARDNNMYITTTLFPKNVFERLGYLDESLGVLHDLEFDLRMAAAGMRFGYFGKPEALIRFHGENRSGVKRFVKTGDQLREFCAIAERYVTPKNFDALAGWNAELSGILQRKVDEIRTPFPAEFEKHRADLEPRIARVATAIASVPAISSAALRGEPLISAVIPHSGRLGPLQRALESLGGQEYDRWEAVVVTDGVADPSPLVAGLGLSDRVRVACGSRQSVGPGASRNLGLGCVNGEVVAYLDDDNRFETGYFAALARAFANPAIAAVAGRSRIAVVDANGDAFEVVESELGLNPDGRVSRVANRLPLNAVAHRRSCLVQTGFFHRGLFVLEDWEFLIRLGLRFPIVRLDEPACVLCFDATLQRQAVYGRKSSAEWSEFASRVQDVYNGYPPESEAERLAREAYLRELQPVIQSGVNGAGNVGAIVAFVRALAGPAHAGGAVAV